MRLILHIGFPKTGTTTIQRVATENIRLLAANGVHWPLNCSYNPSEGDTIGHHKVSDALKSRDFTAAREMLSEAVADAKDINANCIVVSSEGLSTCPPEYYDTIFKVEPFEDIKISCYVRPLPSFLLAWYAQDIHAETLSRNFLQWHRWLSGLFSSASMLQRCNSLYPNKLIARLFDRSNLLGGDIWEDFSRSVIGIDADLEFRSKANDQLGLRGSLLLIKRSLNEVSLISRARELPLEATGGLLNGRGAEDSYLWNMFDILARNDRFKGERGYPLARFEIDYLKHVALKETLAIGSLGLLPKDCVEKMYLDATSAEKYSYYGTCEKIVGDFRWILDWASRIDPQIASDDERLVAENIDRFKSLAQRTNLV